MKRRDFLKTAAASTVSLICPLSVDASSAPIAPAFASSGIKKRVALSRIKKNAGEKELSESVREAVDGATDFSWLSRGDTVFIKTVNNSGNTYPATTSPAAVAAMIGILRERGARRVIVGDMSGVQAVRFTPGSLRGSTRKLMENSGLAAAVSSAGGDLHCFEEAGWNGFYEEIPTKGTHWKGPVMMPDILKEVDHIVLMPRCSRHILTGTTLGLKAAVGYWRHDTRLEYHHDAASLHEKTAEANTVKTLMEKQRLVVTVADRILATIGPDRGYVFEPEPGLTLASESLLAHEMASLAWLLKNRQAMPESEKDGFTDTSAAAAVVVNRVVVSFLSGWGKAISSQRFIKNDITSIRDDRTLAHACLLAGGAPVVSLETPGKGVPAELKRGLSEILNPDI